MRRAGGHRHQPQPHHAAARRRRRRRGRAAPHLLEAEASPSAWRCSATPSTSATPTAWWPSRTRPGATTIAVPGRRLTTYKPGGHWTRSLLASPDGRRLYVGVGSLSNIGELGLGGRGRPRLHLRTRPADGPDRVFAGGLRNPVGLAWEPVTGRAVDRGQRARRPGRRDAARLPDLGADGGFYGWPYCYWGQTVDDRVPQDAARVASALTPDYALGGHTASLGLCWLPAGTLPGLRRRHGDRPARLVEPQHAQRLQGRVRAVRQRPAVGPPRDILSGFLAPDESVSYGRPVGVASGPTGNRCWWPTTWAT
jgi:glucose/arabinose dehydrogenase